MPLEVLCVPPLPCEGWLSIERYVEAIVSASAETVAMRVASPPSSRGSTAVARYRARYKDYPEALREQFHRPDVVHIPDQALAHLVDVFADVPVAVTCHDLMPLLLDALEPRPHWSGWFDRTLLRDSISRLRRADAVIAVSESTKRDIMRLLDVDPARISVVPNMLHPLYRAGVDFPAPRTLPNPPRILSVGRTLPYKNVEAAIQTLAAPALGAANLVRVGDGLTSAQRELARRLGVRERIFELGHLDPAHLAAVYAACDVLVQPSIYEGFGVPVVEAMACGVPVVCSDGGALAELGAEAAVVVPLGADDFPATLAAAIEQVLSQPSTASMLRRKGIACAETFRPAAVFPRLLSAYRAAIEEHAS